VIASFFIYNAFNRKIFSISALIIILSLQIPYCLQRNIEGDIDIGYSDVVKTHQSVIDYCVTNHLQKDKITTHFLMIVNLKWPEAGYLSEENKFTDVPGLFNDSAKYCIVSSVKTDDQSAFDTLSDKSRFHLLKRFENNNAWSEIYKIGN
jgi:hypothetical protein